MVILRQKVAFVGDGTVGKTSIAQMAFANTCPRNYMMTLGVDLTTKEVQVSNDIIVELFMWDISGQEVFKGSAEGHLQNLDWFVAVYDITSKTSFESTARWIDKCRKANKNSRGVLVANKVDLRDKAEVSDQQGEAAAKAHNCAFMQTTCTRGAGITELLKHIAEATARQYEEFVMNESKR